MAEVKQLLEENIIRELENLKKLEENSDKKKEIVSNINTLYELRIEERRLEEEITDKAAKRAIEERRLKSEEKQAWERYLKLALELGSAIFIPILYNRWLAQGYRYEETGVYTSTTLKGLLNQIKPFKK